MEAETGIVLPDILPYLLGVLGLLALWQFHQMQVMKGRILAIDIFDRSGIRMYLYVVADDPQTCEACRSAHGTVFPPSEVMKNHFSPIAGTCGNPAGCIGFLVGLYGAWPEAQQIVKRLRSSHKREPIRLCFDELNALILGSWERSMSASTDRLGIYVLEAVLGDHANPDIAIGKYHYVLENAVEVRHMHLVVPIYFRLVELLIRQERTTEALQFIQQFENRFKGKEPGPHAPTDKQFGLMSIKKSRIQNIARKPASTTSLSNAFT